MFLEQLTETAFEHLCSDFKVDENVLVVVTKEVAKMDLPVKSLSIIFLWRTKSCLTK
jgi:hypothetical protein